MIFYKLTELVVTPLMLYFINCEFASFVGGIEYAGNTTFRLNASKSNTVEADFRPVPLSQVYNHHFAAYEMTAKSESFRNHFNHDNENKNKRQKSHRLESSSMFTTQTSEGARKQWVGIIMFQIRN